MGMLLLWGVYSIFVALSISMIGMLSSTGYCSLHVWQVSVSLFFWFWCCRSPLHLGHASIFSSCSSSVIAFKERILGNKNKWYLPGFWVCVCRYHYSFT